MRKTDWHVSVILRTVAHLPMRFHIQREVIASSKSLGWSRLGTVRAMESCHGSIHSGDQNEAV